jgi:hypothetical protein
MLGSTKTIQNKDMANFTTAIVPWRMKGFGKIIFLTVKGTLMACTTNLLSFSSFRGSVAFWLLNQSEK